MRGIVGGPRKDVNDHRLSASKADAILASYHGAWRRLVRLTRHTAEAAMVGP